MARPEQGAAEGDAPLKKTATGAAVVAAAAGGESTTDQSPSTAIHTDHAESTDLRQVPASKAA